MSEWEMQSRSGGVIAPTLGDERRRVIGSHGPNGPCIVQGASEALSLLDWEDRRWRKQVRLGFALIFLHQDIARTQQLQLSVSQSTGLGSSV